MSFPFAPKGWAQCNGQSMPIAQNQALFSLLGTTFGGSGPSFQLPDLQGKTPIHFGQHPLGERGGEASHTLTIAEMAQHSHTSNATSDPHVTDPENYQPLAIDSLFGVVNGLYSGAANLTPLLPATLTLAGGGQAHPNMQPFLTLNFCIALQGIFPSQN